ncbi:hypothetical protein EZV62_027001 [Acer yangbiense]|uniref:Uncharacterized protein n=1 Tax=Acer yangbiense TaxID=1000413 RepID=A0A5C7GT94_9ROSI|nr:hypothetical protein EZV62_027001 [Acer yangbiense]
MSDDHNSPWEIPLYKVIQILKSKRLFKEPSFVCVLTFFEEKFLEKFVSKFKNDTKELLVAFKAHMSDSSSTLNSP